MKVTIPNIKISSIAACLPQSELDLESFFDLYGKEETEKIISVTGIKKVRYVSGDEISSDLCFQAAEYLISMTNTEKDSIDGVVFVSQTRDYIIPATSPSLQHRLNLSKEVVAFDVPYGCTGYVYGLYLASMLINSGSCKKVLLLAGDVNSKTINKMDRSLTMVFGDAGTASIVEFSKEESIYFNIKTDGSGYDRLIIPAGGYRNPSTLATQEVTERENKNFRSDEDLYMDGMTVFNFAITEVPTIIKESLADNCLEVGDVSLYALHQANELMLKYINKKLKADKSKVPFCASEIGNTGPASIPLMLSTNYAETTEDLSKSLLCGFGVGLTWGTAILNLNDTKIFKPIIYNNQI